MNKAISIFLPCLFLFATGCEILKNTTKKFNNILTVVENGTTFAVKSFLDTTDEVEKYKQYFTDTSSVILEAVSTGKIEPNLFNEYITTNLASKVPAPYNTAVVNALNLALTGYNSFYAANVKEAIDNNDINVERAKLVILAIVDGINIAIDPVSSGLSEGENKSVNPLENFNGWKL